MWTEAFRLTPECNKKNLRKEVEAQINPIATDIIPDQLLCSTTSGWKKNKIFIISTLVKNKAIKLA